jgi:hypothetical protein
MKQIDFTRAIGVLANLGVIVGIVLLAVEIHQNTEMMEAQISQARTETAMAEAQSVYDSEYLLSLMEAIDQGQPLTTTDRLRFAHYLRAFNRNQDNQLWQYRRGLLGENIPRSIRLAVRGELAPRPLAREVWASTKDLYTDDYIEMVDEIIAEYLAEESGK